MGDEGALLIMDIWLKWLIAKPKNNQIYWLGAYLMKVRFFPKFIHNVIIGFNEKSPKKKLWAFDKLKEILDNSVYLVLDLEENVDFDFNDIDEVKHYNFPKNYIKKFYTSTSDPDDSKVEYWNLHTYSNKHIDKDKITLLEVNKSTKALDIIIFFASENQEFIKEQCPLLFEFLNFLVIKK